MPLRRVQGGEAANPVDYPWFASLALQDGNHQCGGVLVDTEWVLTSGHCTGCKSGDGCQKDELTARFLLTPGIAQKCADNVTVEKFYRHPDYSGVGDDPSGVDLALLHLSRPPKCDLGKVALDDGTYSRVGFTAQLLGYGDTGNEPPGGVLPMQLRSAQLPILAVHKYVPDLTSYYLEAHGPNPKCSTGNPWDCNGAPTSASGDGGGPLFNATSKAPVVIGTVTGNGFYAPIAAHRDWITSTVHPDNNPLPMILVFVIIAVVTVVVFAMILFYRLGYNKICFRDNTAAEDPTNEGSKYEALDSEA